MKCLEWKAFCEDIIESRYKPSEMIWNCIHDGQGTDIPEQGDFLIVYRKYFTVTSHSTFMSCISWLLRRLIRADSKCLKLIFSGKLYHSWNETNAQLTFKKFSKKWFAYGLFSIKYWEGKLQIVLYECLSRCRGFHILVVAERIFHYL